MNAQDKLQTLNRLVGQIRSAEAYLSDPECRGSDRRAAKAHLTKLQRAYNAMRKQAIDDVATDGELGALAGVGAL